MNIVHPVPTFDNMTAFKLVGACVRFEVMSYLLFVGVRQDGGIRSLADVRHEIVSINI